jgi:hypothetical protein
MAKQTINIGASANDGTGDPLRNAFDKSNDNFNELYLALGSSTSATNLFDANGNFDLTGKPHKISFYYDTLTSLQALNPGTYHGAIGHAHDTGSMYYAHGSWRRLLADTSGGSILNYTDPLAPHVYANNVTNSETSDYVLKTNADGTYTWVEMTGGGGGGSNSSYEDSDVDAHLNVSGAGSNEVLQWDGSDYTWTALPSGGSSANTFGSIAVAGQTSIAADGTTDTLTLVAGSNVTITTDANADSVTINASGGGGGGGTDLNSLTGGTLDVASDSIGFIDADDSNNSKKDTIADFVTAIAGNNLTASNGVLNASGGSSVSNTDIINAVTASDLDMGGNKVLFNNVYSTEGDLPNASTYHGMFAHVHGTGAAYFAHSGNWVQLANNSDLGGGGGGGASRVQEAETTASISDGASGSVEYATLGLSFALQKVTVDKQCWVRIYSDTASRTADAGRTQGTDPSNGSGVIAEFIATASGTTEFKITPSIMGWLDDSETEVPVAVQNNSGSAGTVTVTIDVLKLES